MTKYTILTTDACGEPLDNLIIIGGHFTEQKAKEILVKKDEMDKSWIIADIHHGFAKKVNNLDEYYPCAESEKGWLVDWGSEVSSDYDRKATIVECCEGD